MTLTGRSFQARRHTYFCSLRTRDKCLCSLPVPMLTTLIQQHDKIARNCSTSCHSDNWEGTYPVVHQAARCDCPCMHLTVGSDVDCCCVLVDEAKPLFISQWRQTVIQWLWTFVVLVYDADYVDGRICEDVSPVTNTSSVVPIDPHPSWAVCVRITHHCYIRKSLGTHVSVYLAACLLARSHISTLLL